MNSARDNVLKAIRSGLGRGPLSNASQQTLEQHLRGETDQSLRPHMATDDPVRLFRSGLEQLSGSLSELNDLNAVPAAVADYLGREQPGEALTVAPALKELDWQSAGLSPRFGRASGDELAGVSRAFCGIIETGSLVLLSGPDNPTTLNFLPEHHLVVLNRADLVNHIEDVWARMRDNEPDWPRTVNIITGPSRTADIEQTIQLGAHGPRRLHVLFVNS